MLGLQRLRPVAALVAAGVTTSAASSDLLGGRRQRPRAGEVQQQSESSGLWHLSAPAWRTSVANQVKCEPEAKGEAKCENGFKRTTSKREFEYVHECDFTPEMREIAATVDFRGMLEDGCFLLEGVDTQTIEKLVFGLKVFAKKGTLLIEEGEPNDAVFVVGSGVLGVYVHGVHIASVGPGQVIGLYTMLKKTMASADVRVESGEAYLLQLRHGHFMNCVGDNHEVIGRMHMMLHQRELQNKAADMISKKKWNNVNS